jgi:hypothetical protein
MKCENYGGTNITNPFIKVLVNLIKNWIEKRYKGNEHQSGFTEGRSTVHHIYVIRQIVENVTCNKKILVWYYMTWKRQRTKKTIRASLGKGKC